MQYRIDPKSGNKLSVLGFGCMRFPHGLTQIDAVKSEKLVLDAIEAGVNYFDTAYVYGGSEETLGEILHKNNARERIFLATKLPLMKCRSYDDFETLFQTQLERLKTDYIDYYLMHNLSETARWDELCALGVEKWIAQKKASGQIRQVGFSFHGAQGECISLLDAYDWEFCQIQYNYMNENYQAGRLGVNKAHEKGIPVIVMEPLLGGKLASGLPAKAAKLFKEADPNISAAEWAMRWLWDQKEVTVALSGMSTAEALADNLKAAKRAAVGMLSEREAAVFDPVREAFGEAYKIPCTGCNYCMPCPKKVNIPGCFAAYNTSYASGLVTGVQQYLTSTGALNPSNTYSGRNCVQCGQCEKQCPQHIEIAKSLKAVTKRMEPFWLRAVMKVVMKFMR